MVKSKAAYANAGLVRCNMGNVQFEQKQYPAAIKVRSDAEVV